MSAMSPLCAQKRTSLEGRMFGPVPSAERRLSPTAARATGPAAMARSPERRPLDIVLAGLCRHRDRRDPAHPGARHHGNADHVVKRRAHPRDRSLDAASNRADDAAGPGDGDPVRCGCRGRAKALASQSTAPPCGLGKGEAGAVPDHGPARLTWPNGTRTAFAGLVPCFF